MWERQPKIVAYLLKEGADPDKRGGYGERPIELYDLEADIGEMESADARGLSMAWAIYLLAWVELKEGRTDEALPILDRAIAR